MIRFQLFVVDNLLERVEQSEFLILVVLDVGVHLDVPEDILAEMTELPGILLAEEKKTISTPTINIINHSIKMSLRVPVDNLVLSLLDEELGDGGGRYYHVSIHHSWTQR